MLGSGEHIFFVISKEIKRLAPESFQESQVLIREKPTGERNRSALGKLEKLVSELAYGWNEASNQENLVVDLVTDWKGSVNRKSPLYLKIFNDHILQVNFGINLNDAKKSK